MKNLLILFALILTGTMVQAQSTFTDVTNSFVSCYDAADATCVSKLFARDAVMIRGTETISGADAIKAYYEKAFQNGNAKLTVNITDDMDMGDYVTTSGNFTVTQTNKDGKSRSRSGTFTSISKKTPRGLRIVRHTVTQTSGEGTDASGGSATDGSGAGDGTGTGSGSQVK